MLAALEKTLNYPLHATAGIILAIVAVEVMPAALRSAPAWLLWKAVAPVCSWSPV
ncbi:MAG: hypothetical protein WBB23_17675 [Desulforhopalus sp.]